MLVRLLSLCNDQQVWRGRLPNQRVLQEEILKKKEREKKTGELFK